MEDLTRALPGLSLSEHAASAPAQAVISVDSGVHSGDVAKPPASLSAEGTSSQSQHQNLQHGHASAPVPEYEAVDAAIRQALADPTQRVTVLKCEDLVEKFIADSVQETLQFPASFTSYQRMLAHRVGQYYGLQTSTVDYEESQGRVVAVRTMHCRAPKPRLRDLDVRSDPVAQRTNGANGLGGPVADKPRLLRRQDDERSQQNSSEHSLNQSPARTMKERHEMYMKARIEFGLGDGPQDGMGAGRGGRGGPGGRFGSGGRMDGGRGRKAVFRDKDKELSDPDYRRGMNRFNGTARFDPAFAAMPAGGIYQVPTYASEFPSLRMASGGPTPTGRPHMQPHPHQMAPGPQPHPIAGHLVHQGQAGPGAWGQQPQQQQGPSGVRPPPPPPPPHHASGPSPSAGAGSGNSSGPNSSKAHHQPSGSGGTGGGMGGRQQQQAFGPTVTAAPYPGVGAQYPVPVAMGTAGFMPGMAAPGQPMFSMAAPGGAIPGAMYTAPAPGVSGAAFYPGVGVGMGMGAMGMAVPTAPAYGYIAPAPGVGMGAPGEAIALTPGSYPVYASYPAGTTMYPAAAAQMSQAAALHPAAGAAIPMRPMYGVPAFYPSYDPSQYPGIQAQGDGRMYGGYGNHHHLHHHGGPHHHGSGGMSHGHGGGGGGRGRDSENGGTRGEAAGVGGPNASGSGAAAGASSGDAK